MTVVIVDYGSGNLRSAAKAFSHVAAHGGGRERVVVSDDIRVVAGADRLVLPGVGAFAACRAAILARPGLMAAIETTVIARRRPFLGICVGAQLLATRGLEFGETPGFGWIEGEVRPLAVAGKSWFNDLPLRLPHMGWNALSLRRTDHPLLVGIDQGTHMYFVHGYHLVCAREDDVLASTDYGGPVTAMVARDNIAGVQFHPEKSQAHGLRLIANFLAWTP